MKSMRILSVVDITSEGLIHVIKEIINDDNSTDYIIHVMPVDIFEWRSAEYGIDDLDELIDIVLHEPYLESFNPLHTKEEDAKTLIRVNVNKVKSKLSNKQHTLNEAKQTLTQRDMDDKYVNGATINHASDIKKICHFDDHVINAKKEHIRKVRADHETQSKIPKTILTPEERANRISAMPLDSEIHDQAVSSISHPDPNDVKPKSRIVHLGGKGNGRP